MLELTESMDLAAMTLPVEINAVAKDQEFQKEMLLIICYFPLGIQE